MVLFSPHEQTVRSAFSVRVTALVCRPPHAVMVFPIVSIPVMKSIAAQAQSRHHSTVKLHLQCSLIRVQFTFPVQCLCESAKSLKDSSIHYQTNLDRFSQMLFFLRQKTNIKLFFLFFFVNRNRFWLQSTGEPLTETESIDGRLRLQEPSERRSL